MQKSLIWRNANFQKCFFFSSKTVLTSYICPRNKQNKTKQNKTTKKKKQKKNTYFERVVDLLGNTFGVKMAILKKVKIITQL